MIRHFLLQSDIKRSVWIHFILTKFLLWNKYQDHLWISNLFRKTKEGNLYNDFKVKRKISFQIIMPSTYQYHTVPLKGGVEHPGSSKSLEGMPFLLLPWLTFLDIQWPFLNLTFYPENAIFLDGHGVKNTSQDHCHMSRPVQLLPHQREHIHNLYIDQAKLCASHKSIDQTFRFTIVKTFYSYNVGYSKQQAVRSHAHYLTAQTYQQISLNHFMKMYSAEEVEVKTTYCILWSVSLLCTCNDPWSWDKSRLVSVPTAQNSHSHCL